MVLGLTWNVSQIDNLFQRTSYRVLLVEIENLPKLNTKIFDFLSSLFIFRSIFVLLNKNTRLVSKQDCNCLICKDCKWVVEKTFRNIKIMFKGITFCSYDFVKNHFHWLKFININILNFTSLNLSVPLHNWFCLELRNIHLNFAKTNSFPSSLIIFEHLLCSQWLSWNLFLSRYVAQLHHVTF